MDEIKRDNHYVPQFYLKQWSHDNRTLYVFRRLVSDNKVPYWSKQSINSVAKQMYLYTKMVASVESDEYENWFNTDFEIPVQEAYYKAINDRHLSADDWRKLIRFTAAQIVRTPTFLAKDMMLWKKVAEDTLNKLPQLIEKVDKKISEGYEVDSNKNLMDIPLKVNVNPEDSTVKVEVTIGRESWLSTIKHLLSRNIDVLLQHSWSIVSINCLDLVTSDDPVICLNYNNENDYNFGGGWKKKNSNIIFPLSPNHLLFTQIGKKTKSRTEFDIDKSRIIQRVIAQHSYRYIYAHDRNNSVRDFCLRIVDAEQYIIEKEQWDHWHVNQIETE